MIKTMTMTRPRPSAPSFFRGAAFALLQFGIIALYMFPSTATVLVTTAVAEGPHAAVTDTRRVAPNAAIDVRETQEEESQRLSEASTETAKRDALKRRFDAGLTAAEVVRRAVEREVADLRLASPGSNDEEDDMNENNYGNDSAQVPSVAAQLRDEMEALVAKAADLDRRTEALLAQVAEHNRFVLLGELSVGEDSGHGSKGLEARLESTFKEEMGRRDRYDARIAEMTSTPANSAENAAENGSTPSSDGFAPVPSPYVTFTELAELLSPDEIVQPSEIAIERALRDQAIKTMGQILEDEDSLWSNRTEQLSRRHINEFENLATRRGEVMQVVAAEEGRRCLSVPAMAAATARALAGHHRDGGTGAVDHAAYENGASVAYELTSKAYVPSPRNGDAGHGRSTYALEKQRLFDAQAEDEFRQRRDALRQGLSGNNGPSLPERLSEFIEDANPLDLFANQKLEALRTYLPDDWERFLDMLSERLDSKGPQWSDYTLRGASDALVPDYVYHSLGAAGRTAGPEVAIGAGHDKSGSSGDHGWNAKPLGHCYPLSMQPFDDPTLSLLNRRRLSGNYEDNNFDAALLTGPKFTVRLPYAVSIDAVTLEHRSFPLPPSSLKDEEKGGESAPRWVRVVGFPPCPTTDKECAALGFDLANPIDLGSFEYQRITVIGREDDYAGVSDEEEDVEEGKEEEQHHAWPGGRRRSVQTFTVNRGEWRPPPLFASEDGSVHEEAHSGAFSVITQCSDGAASCTADSSLGEREEVKISAVPLMPEPDPEELAPGQCAPPTDKDSLPSCSGDGATSSSATTTDSDSAIIKPQRHVVEAVSFIVEENWSKNDYTCLYRVRVHGDVAIFPYDGTQTPANTDQELR